MKRLIKEKIENPINIGNKKILIFTAFTDTAEYLYKNLRDWYTEDTGLKCAMVCGSYTHTDSGSNDYDSILTNFSPVSKMRSKKSDSNSSTNIDLLIATDCISEGQNLQDCDYLINYDIHWNPVRIIQRFGRIDRLGSTNKTVSLVNFWPTKDLDKYLKLKEEIIDLEDMDENVSLTDFSLDDFRIDLINFIENNRPRLEGSPMGLYAVAPSGRDDLGRSKQLSETEKEIIKPGVVFCLKQKETSEENEKINPLSPYFLVYIRDD